MQFRAAVGADVERLSRAVIEGLAEYRSFAPPGWTPPSLESEVDHLRELLGDDSVWCLVAEADGRLAGQITILPAARAVHPVGDPHLAHLRNLFVAPELWGGGLATALHAAAVETARERGFTAMRLFVAAGHARARRFYEREGWAAAAAPFHDPAPDLVIVEYRRPITAQLRAPAGDRRAP